MAVAVAVVLSDSFGTQRPDFCRVVEPGRDVEFTVEKSHKMKIKPTSTTT